MSTISLPVDAPLPAALEFAVRYRAVLFDLDGTFADTAPDLAAAVNRMRTDRGHAPLPLTTLRPMASHGARGLLEVGFGIGPDASDYAAMRDEFLANYARDICVHTRVYPAVAAMVADLAHRGIPWGIVTNKVAALTEPLVAALALPWVPGCVISGDSAARPKPAPDPLLLAAARLGVSGAACVYLGDDARDIQAARAAGMGAVAVAYGYGGGTSPHAWGADMVLDDPGELAARGLV